MILARMLSVMFVLSLALVFMGACESQPNHDTNPAAQHIRGASQPDMRTLIARDINFRMGKEDFNDDSEATNVTKLLTDCVFEEADLGGHGANAIVVKLNWFSDGRKGNYLRGAHDQGQFFVYAVHDKAPVFLGIIEGHEWHTIASGETNGYLCIETKDHEAYNRDIVNQYRFTGAEYKLVSSVMCQYDEGVCTQIEVIVPPPAPTR